MDLQKLRNLKQEVDRELEKKEAGLAQMIEGRARREKGVPELHVAKSVHGGTVQRTVIIGRKKAG